MAAEAAVSFLLNRLAALIEENVRHEYNLLHHADDSVQNLNTKLEEIQMVLEDAENKRLSLKHDQQGLRRVESWLQDLRNITYEIEDAVDEWEVEKIKRQLEESEDASESDSWVEKVRSFLVPTCLCLKKTVHRRGIALQIEQLIAKLDSLVQQNENELKFFQKLKTRHVYRDTTSFVELSEIQGRDRDKEIVLGKLLSGGSGEGGDGVKIISIVGAGGMGKTTLAQLLLKDNRVQDQFQEKLWVCVSDPFDNIKIAKQILEVLGKESSRLSELDPLLQSIDKVVSGRRFFLILDDVWTEDDTKWKPLKACLMSTGASGSRILVTTRNRRVAQTMGSTDNDVVDLKGLRDEDCWSILSQIAFKDQIDTDRRREELEKIGRKIAGKCKGSPLVAKTMGGLLRFREDWESVLKSEMWELEEVRDDIFPLLKLSYDELEPEIKRCFSYCAIFPKDERIEVDELVRMWMAQGFVLPSSRTEAKMELELGRQYLNKLALCSFFQDFEKDKCGHITYCRMHDIVHDFAQFLMNNECLIVDQFDKGEKMAFNEKVVRHLSIISPDGDTAVRESLNLKELRSFINEYLRGPDLFTHLKRVRLLKIQCRGLRDIPREIGKLIHLRYLCFQFFEGKELPETIYDLYNLQTLDISQCRDLCGLPQGIHKLRNLRYLINCGTSRDFKFPQGFEKLVNLRRLNSFSVTRNSGNELGLLKDLNHLEGTLNISIDVGVDAMQANKANLINKTRIQRLNIVILHGSCREVIEALQPHENLQHLLLYNSHCPTWLQTLTKLRSLELHFEPLFKLGDWGVSPGEIFTRSITFPFLEDLKMSGIKKRLSMDEAWTRAFPKLKTLSFHNCIGWEEWEDVSEEQDITLFPELKMLMLHYCPRLKSLPHRIMGKAPSLEVVEIEHCESLWSHYGGMRKEDWEKISSTSVLKIHRYLSPSRLVISRRR